MRGGNHGLDGRSGASKVDVRALSSEVVQVGLSQGPGLALAPGCSCHGQDRTGPSLVVPGRPVPAWGVVHCDCL